MPDATTSQPGPPASENPPRNRHRTAYIVAGIVVAIITAAGITIPIVTAHQQRVAAEEEAAAAAQAERDRLSMFQVASTRCGGLQQHSEATILDGGEAIEFVGVSKNFLSGVLIEDVYCVLDELGAPASLESKIGATRALDGRQTDEWDGFEISWSYHPDDGASVLIEHAH